MNLADRHPRLLGALLLLATAAATAGALLLSGGMFARSYPVTVAFTDAAGLRPGDGVLVAGVRVGSVTEVHLEETDGVVVSLNVRRDAPLPGNATARISVDNLLGTKSVRLQVPDEPDWELLLATVGHIPLTDAGGQPRTSTPVELIEIQDIGTTVVSDLDTETLNRVLDSLTDVTAGAREDVDEILTGFGSLLTEVNTREEDLRSLLQSARSVSGVLAQRDAELLHALDDVAQLAATLADRRGDLVDLLAQATATNTALHDLLAETRPDLDSAIADLRIVLDVVDRHQIDLAHTVAYAASALEGFSQIGYSGSLPLPWTTTATVGAGPLSQGGLAACGLFDRALDLALGPDPLPCGERDTPLDQDASVARSTSVAVATLLRPHLGGPL